MDALYLGAAVGFALILFHDSKKKGRAAGPLANLLSGTNGGTAANLPTANLPGSPVTAGASGCVGFSACGCGSTSSRAPTVPPTVQNLTPGVSNTGITAPNTQWYYNPNAAPGNPGSTAIIGYNPIQYPMQPYFSGFSLVG